MRRVTKLVAVASLLYGSALIGAAQTASVGGSSFSAERNDDNDIDRHLAAVLSATGFTGNIDVHAQVQPAVLCRVRSSFNGLARHPDNVLELERPIQRATRIGH